MMYAALATVMREFRDPAGTGLVDHRLSAGGLRVGRVVLAAWATCTGASGWCC